MKKLTSSELINETFVSSIKHSVDSILLCSDNIGKVVTDKKLIREGWGLHNGCFDWNDCLNIIGSVEIFITQTTPLYILASEPEDESRFDPLEFFDGVSLVIADGGGPRIWLDFNYTNGRAIHEWQIKGDWGDDSFIIKSPVKIADFLGYDRGEVMEAFYHFEAGIKEIVIAAASPPKINGAPMDSRKLYFEVSLDDLNKGYEGQDLIDPETWEKYKSKALLLCDSSKLISEVEEIITTHSRFDY